MVKKGLHDHKETVMDPEAIRVAQIRLWGEVYALGKLRTGEEVRGNYLDLQGWRDPNKTRQVVLGTQACCSDQWLSHCRGFPSLSICTTPAFKVVVL